VSGGGYADERRHRNGGLLDFPRLGARLGVTALAIAAVGFIGIVADGLREGLTFSLMARWLLVALVALVVASALLTAAHAVVGVVRARRRGERVGDPDTGLLPRRRGESADG
jgi:hypothetical protein